MWAKIEKLFGIKHEFNAESQDLFEGIKQSAKNLEAIGEMKKMEGWKILEERIRLDIHNRIREKVKDDIQINSLLNILVLSSVKKPMQQLEEEIDQLLPEE